MWLVLYRKGNIFLPKPKFFFVEPRSPYIYMCVYIYVCMYGNKQQWRGRLGNKFPVFMPVEAVRVKSLVLLRKHHDFQKSFRTNERHFFKRTHEVFT